MKNSGYPSVAKLISLLEDGNVLNMPGITCADIHRAYKIYGEPEAYVHGKMTHKKLSHIHFREDLKSNDKDHFICGRYDN